MRALRAISARVHGLLLVVVTDLAPRQRTAGRSTPRHNARTQFPDTAQAPAGRRTQPDTANTGHNV
eukprot:14687410-Alexandrium_andersonii.AAC.1